MIVPKWEHFPHGADVGIRGYGKSINEAFEQAALAMVAVVADPNEIANTKVVSIQCNAPDLELLFVDWLNALIYEMATRHMLFGKFHVTVSNNRLYGEAIGEKINILKHQPIVEIKGATYTCLRVAKSEEGVWVAQSIIDV